MTTSSNKSSARSSAKYSSGSQTSRRQARRSANRRKSVFASPWVLGALGVGLLAVIGVLVFQGINNSPAASGPIDGLRTFANLDRSHTTQPVVYEQTPPVGGAHFAAWQNCGVYTQPVPNENAVHTLEHGAIWITYQPELAAAEVQKLQEITRQSGYRMLSPYPGLPSPIVLSAWGYQLVLETADDPRLMAFIERYEQNPLGPEPGASCTGGVGQPG